MKRRAAEQYPEPYRSQIAAIERRGRKKYHNVPCTGDDGEKFDSLKERRDCQALRALHGAENIIRQVSLPLGELRLRVDFVRIVERYEDGTFRVELLDTKGGRPTKEWTAKANHLREKHKVTIRII